jgi:uncharacterized membrane protein
MEEPLSVGRLIAFTDGVFAIAITLLVLNFDEPTGADSTILHQLTDQWPALFAYFLSFAVIGRFWIVHHRVFAVMQRLDSGILTLNLLYLSFVGMIPFTTEVLGDYGHTSEAVVLYGAVLAAASLTNWTMIRHALLHDHIHPDHRHKTAPFAGGAALVVPGVAIASIPVGLVTPLGAELMWTALGLAWPLRVRRVHTARQNSGSDNRT